jgi:hypothetical protein
VATILKNLKEKNAQDVAEKSKSFRRLLIIDFLCDLNWTKITDFGKFVWNKILHFTPFLAEKYPSVETIFLYFFTKTRFYFFQKKEFYASKWCILT